MTTHEIKFERKHFPESLFTTDIIIAYTDDPCIGDKVIATLGLNVRVVGYGVLEDNETKKPVGKIYRWDNLEAQMMADELALDPTKTFTRTLTIY